MKFSTVLALGVAPAAMAAKVRNSYPPTRRAVKYGLDTRDGHLAGASPEVPAAYAGGQSQWWQGGLSAGKATQIIIIWQNSGAGHETVKYNDRVTVTETVTATAAPGVVTEMPVVHPPQAAATHTVTVGGPNGNVYTPDSLPNVPVGDMVIFEFLSQNHTVTQSTFNSPCAPLAGGMDTGHQPNPDNSVVPAPQVAMQVTTGDPLWFYCKTGKHCSSGMVFSINPTAEKSQAIFLEKAKQTKQDGAAPPAAPPAEPPAAPPAAPPAESPAAPPAAPPAEGGATPGKGVIGADGSCVCMVTCSASSFPSQAQGLGATGGMSGSLPIRMAGIA